MRMEWVYEVVFDICETFNSRFDFEYWYEGDPPEGYTDYSDYENSLENVILVG